MNMTGDPNQKNKPPMFGFESSYPSHTSNFPHFNQAASGSRMEDPTQCLFASNTPSPFTINNTVQSTANVPFTSGYVFPSTPFLNIPSSGERFAFPFSQRSLPVEGPSNFPESSMFRNQQNPFMGTQWTHNAKPGFTSSFSHLPSTSNGITSRPFGSVFGCKRKTDSPPLPPLKQHITEERMAEHMSRLHISSQTPTSSKETQPVRECRLYMCEEMQRLQTESIIPAQILESVNRPCTALVPWRPPIVPPLRKENNNNEEEPDNNVMGRTDGNGMDMES